MTIKNLIQLNYNNYGRFVLKQQKDGHYGPWQYNTKRSDISSSDDIRKYITARIWSSWKKHNYKVILSIYYIKGDLLTSISGLTISPIFQIYIDVYTPNFASKNFSPDDEVNTLPHEEIKYLNYCCIMCLL